MHVILNGGQFEEVNCFKYKVAADGGCERDEVHRMNKGYRALKSVLSNRGLEVKAKMCLCGVIVTTAL